MRFTNEPEVYGNLIKGDKITLCEEYSPPQIAYTRRKCILGLANFEIRAFLEHGSTANVFNISIRIDVVDQNMHIFKLTSTKLKLSRCIRVSGTTLDKLPWRTIYCGNIISGYNFDLKGELMSGVNEQIIRQRALSMLDDDQTADVELVGIDGSIRAHGCVLAEASPYMRAAFYGDLKETLERRLTMADVNVTALKLLKHFMYTGYVDVIKDVPTLMMVLSLASLLMMPELASACFSSLDEFTAEELWSLLHDAFELKHQVLILEAMKRLDAIKLNDIEKKLYEQKDDENDKE